MNINNDNKKLKLQAPLIYTFINENLKKLFKYLNNNNINYILSTCKSSFPISAVRFLISCGKSSSSLTKNDFVNRTIVFEL